MGISECKIVTIKGRKYFEFDSETLELIEIVDDKIIIGYGLNDQLKKKINKALSK